MKLPDIRNFDLAGKRIILRCDLDVPMVEFKGSGGVQEYKILDDTRIREAVPTIQHLLSKEIKYVALAGHIGRPIKGEGISTLFLWPLLSQLLNTGVSYWPDAIEEGKLNVDPLEDGKVALLENLRFYQGEEDNDAEFTQRLASFGDFFVNDAFACSHREHASIVGLPKLLPHAAGLDLLEEVNVLSAVREKPKRPVVVILGGIKEDKLDSMTGLLDWADKILIGGKLPLIISNFSRKAGSRSAGQFPIAKQQALLIAKQQALLISNERIIIGTLGQEGKDLTLGTVEKFMEIIKKAGTIVWAGPMGEYEIKDYEHGTKIIAQAIIESPGFKIIGGGDTEAALTKFGLDKKIDFIVKQQTLFISSGGGAMLEFLAYGSLPGIMALCE